MASFNRVILVGNVTRDVEIKYTPKGTAVALVGLAVNRHYTNERGEKVEEVTFVDINLFGKTAELAGEYLSKGKSVLFEGRLKMDVWKDKQTDKQMSRLKVIGETMQFLGGKPQKKEEDDTPDDNPPPPKARTQPKRDPDLDAEEDEIPF